jgi:hypothetical protein
MLINLLTQILNFLLARDLTGFNVTTAGTNSIKTTSGYVGHAVVNGGILGSVTIYDGPTTGKVLYGPLTPAAGDLLLVNVNFKNGLTIVMTANTFINGGFK